MRRFTIARRNHPACRPFFDEFCSWSQRVPYKDRLLTWRDKGSDQYSDRTTFGWHAAAHLSDHSVEQRESELPEPVVVDDRIASILTR